MKIIIAGGRDYAFDLHDQECLDWLLSDFAQTNPISEVVTGGANGADNCGYLWAVAHQIPTRIFRPAWGKHGKAAGPLRNREMAEYVGESGMLVLFPGGRGTASMWNEALKVGMKIFEPRKS